MFYIRSHRVGSLIFGDYGWDILARGIVVALFSLISLIFTAVFSVKGNIQTATCTTLILTQFITGLQCYKYPSKIRLRNRISMYWPLWVTVFSCMAIHLLILYVPFTQSIVDFNSLSIEWLWISPFCLISMLPIDLTRKRR